MGGCRGSAIYPDEDRDRGGGSVPNMRYFLGTLGSLVRLESRSVRPRSLDGILRCVRLSPSAETALLCRAFSSIDAFCVQAVGWVDACPSISRRRA